MRNPTKDWSKLWPQMRKDFQSGKFSLMQLAAKHGIAVSSVFRRATKEAWSADRIEAKENLKRIEAKENAIKENSKRIDPHVKVIAASVVSRAMSVAAREGTRIGHSAGAFVQRTLDEVTEWLDLIAVLRRDLPAKESLQFMPQWRSAIEKGREAYRLDDVDPVQPLVRIDTISQALDLYEAAPGQWEQQVGHSVVIPPAEAQTEPIPTETPQPVVGPTPEP